MRHGDKVKKFGRYTAHRKAMMRNLAKAFFKYEAIKTTLHKAKALRPYVEKIITQAMNDTLHSRRTIAKKIDDKDLINKLFGDIAKRYANRPGGYTRIYKLGQRISDSAEMALIEMVPESLDK